MPPRVSLNTSPRASRKVISRVNQTDGGEPAPTDNSFTSALDVPPRRPTALRRRGSDGDSPRYRYRDSSSHHNKYPSMDSPAPTEPHPLLRRASTTARTARYDTAGNTRPRLSRALFPSTPVLAKSPPPPPAADFPALPDKVESHHRTVLAHEVSPNDSLAGVALKYGISVTELRRANQLWASDSIHLRQVLYVPLDKARHADLETVASLLAQRPDSNDDTVVRDAAPGSHLDTNASDSSPVVQRIPSTSLSFFPPPSSRPGTPPPGTPVNSVASTTPFHSRSRSRATISTPPPPPPRVSNLASNLRSTALSSFFSILPLNASTRDEIMSRLSIDSNSNSTTGTASDEDEHELTTVPTTPKLRADASASISTAPLATGSRRRKSPARAWVSRTNPARVKSHTYHANATGSHHATS
ncbi:hypothetical protein F5888DRAFT_100802 [Russula emetica]|nr:hypothetical protein F5888DRAFT_100802 [Russula emetica]